MTQITNIKNLTDEEYWDGLSTRSLARFFLLSSLNESPKHGYELKKSIAEYCDGCCGPTDAMIYPTLKELVTGGYVACKPESVGGRTRNVCELTPRGREALAAAARVWGRLLPALTRTVDAAPVASVTENPAGSEVTTE
jgi:DNA-binding PadR family transcriptional regulator